MRKLSADEQRALQDLSLDPLTRGTRIREALVGNPHEMAAASAVETLAPEMVEWMKREVFGNAYGNPAVPLPVRSLCTIAMLAALGRAPQLRLHLSGALKLGVSEEAIVEILKQVAFYAGIPCCSSALAIALEVFREAKSSEGNQHE